MNMLQWIEDDREMVTRVFNLGMGIYFTTAGFGGSKNPHKYVKHVRYSPK
jgi:hypothetical protein